jgi:hypothetical protein
MNVIQAPVLGSLLSGAAGNVLVLLSLRVLQEIAALVLQTSVAGGTTGAWKRGLAQRSRRPTAGIITACLTSRRR